MNGKTHSPRNINFSVDRLESLIDSALEHASHGWHALEKETTVNRINPDSWPPQVEAEVGSAAYHLAALITYVYEAYGAIAKEKERQDEVTGLVNKYLGNKSI